MLCAVRLGYILLQPATFNVIQTTKGKRTGNENSKREVSKVALFCLARYAISRKLQSMP
jgi:hypothetical protein